MSDYDFKYRAPEALEKLRAIIDAVEKRHPRSPSILPSFLSLTYGGYEDQWHHAYASFMCSVEYKQKDVDSQLRALEALKHLSEHISANEEGWDLPTGSKSVRREWHKAPGPDGAYHLQVTENSIMDSSVSEHGKGGAVSINLGVGPLQMNYTGPQQSWIGLLVRHRYRSLKEPTTRTGRGRSRDHGEKEGD